MNKYAKLFIFTAIYDIFISSLSDVNTAIISLPNTKHNKAKIIPIIIDVLFESL